MKKKLALISLLFTAVFPSLFAQTLQPGMRLEYLDLPFIWTPPSLTPDTFSLSITGDTLINGTTWLKMPREPFPCFHDDPSLVREEGSKVYYYFEGEEHLLYDYSLNPGDTLWQEYFWWNSETSDFQIQEYPLVMGDTSSVFLGGEWRKKQEIDWWATPVAPYHDMGSAFIEGFGSVFYFFPQYGLCEQRYCLRAVYWPNGDSILVDISITGCPLISSLADPDISSVFSVWPNPASEVLYIHLPGAAARLLLFNATGQLLRGFALFPGQQFMEIDIRDLPAGIFFVALEQNGEVIERLPVSIQR